MRVATATTAGAAPVTTARATSAACAASTAIRAWLPSRMGRIGVVEVGVKCTEQVRVARGSKQPHE